MSRIDRRKFVGAAAVSGIVTIVPRHVLGAPGHVAPSDKITVANIGMGTQGFRELEGLLADPHLQVVAVCDPNTDSNDYVEWSKGSMLRLIRRLLGNPSWREGGTGCPGGREVGRQVVDAWYARERKAEKFKACTPYADFRELLEEARDLDAVKIMTPDHLHAAIAVAAMRKGKHVMTHKPLANRLSEGRLVVETARKTKRATHLLAYGAAPGNAAIARAVKQGAIGRLREIHNWTNRPVWPQYSEIPTERPPVPKGFDWDLWLGPALDRPYHPHYTHTVFRGWYDFGGGSMADMGIYSLWPVFTTLDLDVPISAQAWATHTCAIRDHVSRPVKNDFAYPIGCTIRLRFAAHGDRAQLDLFWYDGGMKPRLPDEVEAQDVELAGEGILFVGENGSILAGFHGQNPELFARGKRRPLRPPEPPADGGRRGHGLWVEAIRGGRASPGNFLNAAAITDAVNLGTVALRAGTRVLFDSDKMEVTYPAEANRYLRREYREGWEM
ncbi:MAG TPA: Gfo/Idh/MocA family oxidoreductase [Planctomycetaceae bacterium]|nr:Gfo/Idh/MocA family oxidoreductase [Planctomycetaceae bacterium]